jgi:hypothetical protein
MFPPGRTSKMETSPQIHYPLLSTIHFFLQCQTFFLLLSKKNDDASSCLVHPFLPYRLKPGKNSWKTTDPRRSLHERGRGSHPLYIVHFFGGTFWCIYSLLLETVMPFVCWQNSRFHILCITQPSIAFKPAESGWGSNQKYENNFDQIFGKSKKNDEKTTPANSSSGEESQHQNEWTDPRHPSNNGHTYMTKKCGFGREVAVQLVP